jgi:hypothetical protein
MLTKDLAGTGRIVKKPGSGEFALEFLEAATLPLDQRFKIHNKTKTVNGRRTRLPSGKSNGRSKPS